jgi:ABC-2 type transport system ATP-binding protein
MSKEKIFEVENLTKTYRGKDGTVTHAVKGISFSVEKGSIFGIIGANGAGKSTTIDCVLGVKECDSGSVKILGEQLVTEVEGGKKSSRILKGKEHAALFENIGVQFQDSRFQDKLRVSESCELTSSLYQNPASWRELLEDFGLAGTEQKYINTLSGGQKQKLALIQALIPNPKIAFLDELTTGLDPSSRRKIWNYLKKMQSNGMSIILTSHYMDEVEFLCDRIAILKDGLIQAEGSPAELIAQHNAKNLEETILIYMDKSEDDNE